MLFLELKENRAKLRGVGIAMLVAGSISLVVEIGAVHMRDTTALVVFAMTVLAGILLTLAGVRTGKQT